jgi:hypothetical protein
MYTKPLTELMQELPPDAQEVVREFIEFLLSRRPPKLDHPLRQDWAGALRSYRRQYTSLDLQHRALDWRVSP